MTDGDKHDLFVGRSVVSDVLHVQFRKSAGAYQVNVGLLLDSGSWSQSAWQTITDAPHSIEVDWQAATAPGATPPTTCGAG
jgi:hypothetical protein